MQLSVGQLAQDAQGQIEKGRHCGDQDLFVGRVCPPDGGTSVPPDGGAITHLRCKAKWMQCSD